MKGEGNLAGADSSQLPEQHTAAVVRERPILFSGPMVRAILDGTKTQTRRVVRDQPASGEWEVVQWCDNWHFKMPEAQRPTRHALKCPYGAPGDRLWVRETCRTGGYFPHPWAYRADGVEYPGERWTPAIHMPRSASRITLEVTEVRVQRLQEISGADARAEGIEPTCAGGCEPVCQGCNTSDAECFWALWDSINGKRPGCAWSDNPWVWCVSFQRTPETTP